MKKIVFIVGSLREKSFNGSLAKLAETALQGKAEIEYIKADAVPFLNQDIEFPAPESVARVRNIIKEADALWIFSPEYNYNIPGGLKNLLDWLSRPLIANDPERMTVVVGKRVTICGFALPPSAFATGAWEPEQEVVAAIEEQAAELLQALA